jgi:hypothetical protein
MKKVKIKNFSFPTWMFCQNFVNLSLCPPPVRWIKRSCFFVFAVVVVARLAAAAGGGRVLGVVVVVVSDFGFSF